MNGTAAHRAPSPAIGTWSPSGDFVSHAGLDAADAPFFQARFGRRRIGFLRQASYVAIDIFLVCLGAISIYGARFGFASLLGLRIASGRVLIHPASPPAYPAFLVLYAALIVMACMSHNLYRTSRELNAFQESLSVAQAVGLATTLLVLFIFISGNKEISRLVVVCTGVLNVGTLAGWRYSKRRYVLRRARRGEGVSRTLIIGAGKLGHALASWLDNNRQLGYAVCGFLDPSPNGDPRVLGSIQDLRKVALEQFVDQLFVTLPADREIVKNLWVEARTLRLSLNVVPDIYDGLGWRAPMRSVGGFPTIQLHGQPIPAFGLVIKRAMDLLVASLGLIFISPFLAIVALWIRFDSPGPAFYSAPRIGRKGKKFRCCKLRTMVCDADARKETLRCSNERHGPFFKMENDPRVTRCGRWLRQYSFDELPQLWNVLFGDMSLVGPRPHPEDDFARYSLEHLRRLDVKPGITGLWQVTARRDPSFDTNMALDLEYIEFWSLALDLKILFRTLPAVFNAEGS